MANAVVLAGWEGQGVRVGQVVDTIAHLRHQASRAATRATVLTLVIVALSDSDEARATATVHLLGDQHPARILVVRPEPDGLPRIDARVSIWGNPDGDANQGPSRVSLDEVCLTVGGPAAGHLDSVIEPLTLPDVPVVVWYPGKLPAPSAPLLATASTVIVDSKEAGDDQSLADIASLVLPRASLSSNAGQPERPGDGPRAGAGASPTAGVRRAVVDLSWVRLTPWRELLAGLFDGEVFGPFARAVRSGTVEGKPGPRHLLGGWLASRLELSPSALVLVDSIHAGIHLIAAEGNARARIDVKRAPAERVVRAGIAIEGGPSRSTVVSLPDDSLSWSLSRALSHGARDRVWEEALRAALLLGS